MVTALEKAEKERDSVKVVIGRLETKLASNAVVPLTELMVNSFLQQAQSALTKVNKAFEKIVECAPADMDPHNIEHLDLLERVEPLVWGFTALKAAYAPVPPPPPPKTADVKLPRLELPTFDGNIQNWISFHDQFHAAIHSNALLKDNQKLSYLKSSLTGEAARQVKSLAITDDNYDIAWTQLRDRYNNERELLFSIMRRFTNQGTLTGNSATALRSLIDVSKECIRAMTALKLPVDQGDSILLFLIFSKVDHVSREMWEQTLTDSAIPPLKGFVDFLEQRARALAAGGNQKQAAQGVRAEVPGHHHQRRANANHGQAISPCKVCKENHQLHKCPKFLAMSSAERYETVKKLSLCFNCLQEGHSLARCTSAGTCRSCGKKHHSLIHKDKSSTTNTDNDANVPILNHHSNYDVTYQQTMLATAMVRIQDCHGQYQSVRALMDGGSNSNFITESCMQRLGIPRQQTKALITGLASSPIGTARGSASLLMLPRSTDTDKYSIQALIMPKVTGILPTSQPDQTQWSHLQGLELADPMYYQPGPVDLLLGAEVFYNCLSNGKVTGPNNSPVAVRTTFGWLIAGNINAVSNQVTALHTDTNLDRTLQQFWEIENVSNSRALTVEEDICNNHFISTHERDRSGRFVVKLPFKDPIPTLGKSRDIAVRRLKQLEGRFSRQPDRQRQYRDFMNEYIELGHMQEVPSSDIPQSENPVYIPHHFVIKESSSTTKLRVVFDASAKTSTGVSLNDTLLVGPTIQDNLADILMRFRIHPIVFVADITKMYRQFLIHPSHTDYQRILWRDKPQDPIKDYRLLTVTYGTASAPFLATRSLQQLAEDSKDILPLAYNPTMKDFYVDNLMTGCKTVDQALKVQSEIIQLMEKGGMELRQWSSNCAALLDTIPVESRETQSLLILDPDQTMKTLGVYWNPVSDSFSFKVSLDPLETTIRLTKRKLLSEISKLFDPLGWLAPIIIKPKILIQQLWKLQLGWDDPLPEDIQQYWHYYRNNLNSIEQLTIPRCVITNSHEQISLVGFCDASEKAYAAVVYLCSYLNTTDPSIYLLTSKTRVAPARTISLPRLELCGAVLLAQLMSNVRASLNLEFQSVSAWTDSTVVLAWIQSHPSRWKTFVANRVTEIQSKLPTTHWGHVRGLDNPADCASRGIDPNELKTHSLWWTGPHWLLTGNHPQCDQLNPINNIVQDEERKVICNCTLSTVDTSTILLEEEVVICNTAHSHDQSLIHQYSSLRTLTRVTAYILRFVNNCMIKIHCQKKLFPSNQPRTDLSLFLNSKKPH